MADRAVERPRASARPRVKVPRQARAGEIILVRAKLRHPMETGWREDAIGQTVPRNRVNEFVCKFDGTEVFRAELHAGVSSDPYLAFHFKAVASGTFTCSWFEDGGEVYSASAAMEVV